MTILELESPTVRLDRAWSHTGPGLVHNVSKKKKQLSIEQCSKRSD